MKAVATALVLIAGAAVVLWYGNTLNSWVLGGLIGGLAALLLSIPISLTLFSYFSRRYDERVRVESQDYRLTVEDEFPFDDEIDMGEIPKYSRRAYTVVEAEAEVYPGSIWREDKLYGQQPIVPVRQLPAPRHLQSTDSVRVPSHSIKTTTGSVHRPAVTRHLTTRGRDISRRSTTTRRLYHSGSDQTEDPRSRLRSQALRTARLEAARKLGIEDSFEEDSVSPPSRNTSSQQVSRKAPVRRSTYGAQRSSYSLPAQDMPDTSQYSVYPRRRRQMMNADPIQTEQQWLMGQDEDDTTNQAGYQDRMTDQVKSDFSTGDMRKPLQRRAPYTYEDDSIRRELSQYVDAPITRRSSRKLSMQHDDE
jgi:hypothetical protein